LECALAHVSHIILREVTEAGVLAFGEHLVVGGAPFLSRGDTKELFHVILCDHARTDRFMEHRRGLSRLHLFSNI